MTDLAPVAEIYASTSRRRRRRNEDSLSPLSNGEGQVGADLAPDVAAPHPTLSAESGEREKRPREPPHIILRACCCSPRAGSVGALPRAGIVNPLLLPPLSDVLAMLANILGRPQVQEAVAVTAGEVILAFIIAVPLGAAIGVLAAESDYFGQIFKPMLFYVFSIPKSIFLPMFILVFGIGFGQKVAYAAFSTIFIVIMSAAAAVESVKADHVLVAR